jgi:hypothetical protein
MTMKTIHCIAFDPVNGNGAVGGVNWRIQHSAAEQLYLQLQQDPDYDNCRITYFEVRVPEWTSNQEITELVDEKAWAEDYVSIRRRDAITKVVA